MTHPAPYTEFRKSPFYWGSSWGAAFGQHLLADVDGDGIDDLVELDNALSPYTGPDVTVFIADPAGLGLTMDYPLGRGDWGVSGDRYRTGLIGSTSTPMENDACEDLVIGEPRYTNGEGDMDWYVAYSLWCDGGVGFDTPVYYGTTLDGPKTKSPPWTGTFSLASPPTWAREAPSVPLLPLARTGATCRTCVDRVCSPVSPSAACPRST